MSKSRSKPPVIRTDAAPPETRIIRVKRNARYRRHLPLAIGVALLAAFVFAFCLWGDHLYRNVEVKCLDPIKCHDVVPKDVQKEGK